MRTVWSALAVGSTVVALVACSGDDDSSDESAPPVPSATTGSTVESSEPATTPESTTTAPESTTSELNPVPTPPEVSLPPTTTVATVELPPVPTLVPQVPAELLTPEQLDPFSVDNSRPILPEHVPVIEAYLQAIQAATLVSSRWPIDPNAPELVGAPFTPESLRSNQGALAVRLADGHVLDVGQGVVFRPYMVGPVTDAAMVYDCELAGHYWVNAETGEPLPPNDVWPASPGRVFDVGLSVDMVLRDGQWLVQSSRITPDACA